MENKQTNQQFDEIYIKEYETSKLIEYPSFLKRLSTIIKIFNLLSKTLSSNKIKRIVKLIKHPLTTYLLIKQSIGL